MLFSNEFIAVVMLSLLSNKQEGVYVLEGGKGKHLCNTCDRGFRPQGCRAQRVIMRGALGSEDDGQ